MKDTAKVTLTLGQLKKLVKESLVKEKFGDDETIPADQVNEFEEHLRTAQKEVEAAARIVCSSHNENAILAWRALSNMSEDIADVIHNAYKFGD